MEKEKVYLVGIHRYSYKAGIPGEIIGADMIYNEELHSENGHICYHVKWSNGDEDWVPIYDNKNYKIITFKDILSKNIPEITE
jgi:hypothetical protein